jgi:hypothetical protein
LRWCSSRGSPRNTAKFFQWIKQHPRIKAFYGAREKAGKTQIRIAASVYMLVGIVRERMKLKVSRYRILWVLSVACRKNDQFTGTSAIRLSR